MKIGSMMKQAQQMQTRLAEAQARLETLEVTGKAGGGKVAVTLTGKGEARCVALDPALLAEGDAALLEDLILLAINDARAQSEALNAEEMKKITGGLALPPGLKLPF